MSVLWSSPPSEPAARRHFEWQVFRLRWLTLPLALALVTALRSPPVWLSLLALAGYLLHNLARGRLLRHGTITGFRMVGGLLFGVDIGVVLLGLAPMLLAGVVALKVVLFALILEAAARLGLEPPRRSVPGMAAITLAVSLYAGLLEARIGEGGRDVAVWVGLLIAAGIAGWFSARNRWRTHRREWRPSLTASVPDPPEPAPVTQPTDAPVAPLFAAPPPNPLTAKQRRILRLVETGLTNDEIARALDRGSETVHSHLRLIYRRLAVHDRDTAAHMARARGWLDEN